MNNYFNVQKMIVSKNVMIKEILIITNKEDIPIFKRLLSKFKKLPVSFKFEIQKEVL